MLPVFREAALARREEVRAGRTRPYDDLDAVRSLDVRTVIVSSNQHETIELVAFGTDTTLRTGAFRPSVSKDVQRLLLLDHLDLRDAFDAYFGREHSMAGVDPAFLRRDHRADYELSALYDLRALVRTSAD